MTENWFSSQVGSAPSGFNSDNEKPMSYLESLSDSSFSGFDNLLSNVSVRVDLKINEKDEKDSDKNGRKKTMTQDELESLGKPMKSQINTGKLSHRNGSFDKKKITFPISNAESSFLVHSIQSHWQKASKNRIDVFIKLFSPGKEPSK